MRAYWLSYVKIHWLRGIDYNMLNKEVEQYFREMMGDDFWDNLYYYQKIYLCYTPNILKLVKRQKKIKEQVKCLVANKD